ncbi:MAG TPA: acyl-CoA dehydrogenase family protein, partial [Acidimicrobiales bacterium]
MTEDAGAIVAFRAELRQWIAASWDPDLTVDAWWQRIADAGWAAPSWPARWGGRDADRRAESMVIAEFLGANIPGPPGGVGITHAAPTILMHGDDKQRERYLYPTLTGQVGWCQLFSEPEAGSDLAGLQTRAVQDGDEWIVTGQKVWTTLAHVADYAMLLVRTDPNVPKHQGISWMVLNMDSIGVEVRPLRQMNGHEEFNEVFLDEVHVPAENVVGQVHGGWSVGLTTLAYERASHQRFAAPGDPGTKSGVLERRVGDFVAAPKAKQAVTEKPRGSRVVPLARRFERTDDPIVR